MYQKFCKGVFLLVCATFLIALWLTDWWQAFLLGISVLILFFAHREDPRRLKVLKTNAKPQESLRQLFDEGAIEFFAGELSFVNQENLKCNVVGRVDGKGINSLEDLGTPDFMNPPDFMKLKSPM